MHLPNYLKKIFLVLTCVKYLICFQELRNRRVTGKVRVSTPTNMKRNAWTYKEEQDAVKGQRLVSPCPSKDFK